MHLFRRNQNKTWMGVALALATASFGAAAAMVGCSDDTEYAYFSINVKLSPAIDDDTRRTIAACSLTVEGDDTDFVALPCRLNGVPYEVGTAEFSTNKTRGQLKFVAVMRNLNSEIIAQGESPLVAIVPNMLTATTITAELVSPVAPDGGSDAMPGLDGQAMPMDGNGPGEEPGDAQAADSGADSI